jgi:hypothetical protein
MATKLDLADAQFIGFKAGKWNWNGIIDLVQSMGLTKKEWEKWKVKYPNILDDSDFEAVERYFKKSEK